MKSVLIVSVLLVLGARAALAQHGETVPMRDGSAMVIVNGCLVQYGAGNERINSAMRCTGGDLREADRIRAGSLGPDPDMALPRGSWARSCRAATMHGPVLHAECRNNDGHWNDALLDTRKCSTGDAENRDGSLTCY